MKSFGCRLVQCYDGHDLDVLECKYTGIIVPLKTENGILVLSTKKNDLKVKSVILKDIMTKRHSALICPKQISSTNNTSTSMTMNVAKLDEVQLARLWHWRLGHPAHGLPLKMGEGVTVHLNEDCYCCDQSKFKVGSFPRNDPELHRDNPPWWRAYADAYDGGKKGAMEGSSLGGESYEGAVGGFVFVCPSSGTWARKLYATPTQFPAILFQFLQDVERQHFVCRELYVDTTINNISTEAEDLAAQFHCKICPISAGTPQELAYAESCVKNLAVKSRALLNGAKHLPK